MALTCKSPISDKVVLSLASMMGHKQSLLGSFTQFSYAVLYHFPLLISPYLSLDGRYLEKQFGELFTKLSYWFIVGSSKEWQAFFCHQKLPHLLLRCPCTIRLAHLWDNKFWIVADFQGNRLFVCMFCACYQRNILTCMILWPISLLIHIHIRVHQCH